MTCHCLINGYKLFSLLLKGYKRNKTLQDTHLLKSNQQWGSPSNSVSAQHTVNYFPVTVRPLSC